MSYGYDNKTRRGSDSFTFDYLNRMTGATVGGVTSTSTYNGDGLRMSHTVSGTPTNYVWDVNRGLPQVLMDGANKYVYGLDLISATDGAGATTYFTTVLGLLERVGPHGHSRVRANAFVLTPAAIERDHPKTTVL